MNEDAIRFHELDESIIGTDHNGFIVYDYDTMLALCCHDGMTTDEAVEWIDYNVLGTNAGNGFTMLMRNRELTLEELYYE